MSRDIPRSARIKPSGLMARTGKIIIVDARSPVVDCDVVEVSASGACLDVANPAAIPDTFMLMHGVTQKSCRVIWRKGRRLGVQF